MSGSVNKVILVGNLGRDPEIRMTQDGRKVVNLNIATSESWKDRMSGERKEKTEWHRVVIFNDRLVDVAERFLKKGSTVYIEGQLQTRKWTDAKGVEKYTTEIVLQQYRGEMTLLGSKPEGAGAGAGGGYGGQQQTQKTDGYGQQQQTQGGGGYDQQTKAITDDEIPF